MPVYSGSSGIAAGRAAKQASANTETQSGSVTQIYTDANGNVTAADVLLAGTTRATERVTNNSGLKLYKGAPVQVNFLRGSRRAPSIVGGSGSSAATALAANSTAASTVSSTTAPDLSGIPLLLEGADDAAPDGYVAMPGANVFIQSIDPVDTGGSGGGSGDAPGQWILSARPLVLATLPDPTTTTLQDGTCVDLIDSYQSARGMFRLDAVAKVWRRRDSGTSASGSGSGGGGGTSTGSGGTTSASSALWRFTVPLLLGASPTGTGPSLYEFILPAAPDGSTLYYTPVKARLRLATAASSGTTTAQAEWYSGTGAFSAAASYFATSVASGDHEPTSGPAGTTTMVSGSGPATGDKFRANLTALGTGAVGVTFEMEFTVSATAPSSGITFLP